MMSLIILGEAILKIVIFCIAIHFFYLIIVKISLQKNSQDLVGGLVAKFFNHWLDVVDVVTKKSTKKNIDNITDQQYKLMLLMHILPASLVTALIWQYLLQTVLIVNAVFLLLIVFSTTKRN